MSVSIPTPIPISRPRPEMRILPTPRPRPTGTLESLPNNLHEVEKMEMVKPRPVPGNIWCQWYDWLIRHIPESMKSVQGIPNKVMRLF